MQAKEIQMAEQEVRDLEVRYRQAITDLRPGRREPFPLLGEVDGVRIIEVGIKMGGKNAYDRLESHAIYLEQGLTLLSDYSPWRTISPMKRTVKLHREGLPHFFGIATEGQDNPSEVGIYVPIDSLVGIRERHIDEVLKEYPAVLLNLAQLRDLNISPDFIFRINATVNLGKVIVDPVTDSRTFSHGKDFGWPPKVTEFYMPQLDVNSDINFSEFFEGKRDPLLEKIRNDIGASAYQHTAGWGKERQGPNDYIFRFNRVLYFPEMADALRNLDPFEKGTFEVTFQRLSDRLMELVNVPLNNAKPSQMMENILNRDRERERGYGHTNPSWNFYLLTY